MGRGFLRNQQYILPLRNTDTGFLGKYSVSLAGCIASGGSTDHIPLSGSIEQDPSILPAGGTSGDFDGRRVMAISIVVAEEPPVLNICLRLR